MGWREFLGLEADHHDRRREPPDARRAADQPEAASGRGTYPDDAVRAARYSDGPARHGEPRFEDQRDEEQRYLAELYRLHAGDRPAARPPTGETQREFRYGDVDEAPDGGMPASHGSLDQPMGRAFDDVEPLDRGQPVHGVEPVNSGYPAEGGPTGAWRRERQESRARQEQAAVPAWRHDPPTAEQRITEAAAGKGSTAGSLAWRFPPQQVVASYETHGQAARAVDYLAEQRFPVERTAIVGRGLESVETIGRQSWRDSTMHTIGVWAVAGALVGWVIGLLDWASPLRAAFSLALWGLLFGALLGLVGGLLMRSLSGGKRQRITHSHVYRADSYDLLCDTDIADRARHLLVLAGFPVTGAVRRAAATSAARPVGDQAGRQQ